MTRLQDARNWVFDIYDGPYGIDARAHEVGSRPPVARRSSNSGAPVWNAPGDRQPCRSAVTCAPGRLSAVCSRASICSPAAAHEITGRDRRQRPPTGNAAAECACRSARVRGQAAMPTVAER